MLDGIPDRPYFVPPLRTGLTGVDFLGLRQVNFNLMDECLPGVSNATRYLRPFALACWIYWKFIELSDRKGRKTAQSDDLRIFMEKIETLFTWGHVLKGVRGLPGLNAKPPRPVGGTYSLLFKDWKRNADNTSIMAAGTYGPATKTGYGLALLKPLEQDFYRLTDHGERLARALDRGLRTSRGYPLLDDLARTKAREEDAKLLFKAWHIGSPSREEAIVLGEALYAPTEIGNGTRIGRRSATIRLILHVLDRTGHTHDAAQIRERLFDMRLSRARTAPLPVELQVAHLHWRMLQVRQAQRFAFESLFAWVEYQMQQRRARDIGGLVAAAVEDMKTEALVPSGKSCAVLSAKIFAGVDSLQNLIAKSCDDERLSLFRMIDRLNEALADEDDWPNVLPLSLLLLLLCAKLTELLSEDPRTAKGLGNGGADRVSLHYWAEVLHEHQDAGLADFFEYIFEDLIVSQHLMVATGRFDGTASRFRFAVEEEGFVFLDKYPTRPAITPDRLQSTLSLLADCRIVARNGDGYSAL